MSGLGKPVESFQGGFLFALVGTISGMILMFPINSLSLIHLPLWFLPMPFIALVWSFLSDLSTLSEADFGFVLGYLFYGMGTGGKVGLASSIGFVLIAYWLTSK